MQNLLQADSGSKNFVRVEDYEEVVSEVSATNTKHYIGITICCQCSFPTVKLLQKGSNVPLETIERCRHEKIGRGIPEETSRGQFVQRRLRPHEGRRHVRSARNVQMKLRNPENYFYFLSNVVSGIEFCFSKISTLRWAAIKTRLHENKTPSNRVKLRFKNKAMKSVSSASPESRFREAGRPEARSAPALGGFRRSEFSI